MVPGKTGYAHVKKQNYSNVIPLTKSNSKWIQDLNIRPETMKLLEENIGKKLLDMGLINDFLDVIPKAQAKK